MISDEVLTHDLNADALEIKRDLEASRDRERGIAHNSFYFGIVAQPVLVQVAWRTSGGRKLVSQRQLLKEVWGPKYEDETNYLRVFMTQIRRKLEPDPPHPRYFITEPGMGYRFESGDD